MIQWEEKYVIGVKDIDQQHKWIFDFVNNLEEQLNSDDKKVKVDQILKSMLGYSQKHFHFEEGCMNRWKCPVAAKNKDAHKHFLFAYENFMERYEREGHSQELAWKIHDMVEKWIRNHICQIDMHLKDCTNIHEG